MGKAGYVSAAMEVTAASVDAPRGGIDRWVDDPRVRRAASTAALIIALYAVQRRLWPAPLGVQLQGVVIGGLTALISFGLALVYRANRIINFAQGSLGALPASLAVLLIVGPGLPYFLALPVGIAAAIALGGAVEFLLIRRFFKAPRLILTVITIGISQLLAGLGFLLPRAFDIQTPPQSFPSPFDFSFRVGQTVFRGNDIIAMVAVVICIIGLTLFFRFTNIGIAVRASAESADRAALLGVPVKRIETIVWVLATLLAALAVFLRAGIVGLPFGQLLGPLILVRALAAAVIGRMERLPTIFFAALGIGVLESAITFSTGRSILVDPILFVIILAALLLQRRGVVARTDEGSSWQAAHEVRKIPRELSSLPEVVWGRRGFVLLIVAVLVGLPTFLSSSQINLAAVIAIYAILAVSLVVLTGWAGHVSLGQVAFLGIGAAVSGYLTTDRGWELSVAMVAAGLAGAAAATVIGLPALRIRGLFLAVTTLAFAVATSSYLLNENFFKWLPTDRFERPLLFGRVSLISEERYYYFTLACLFLAMGMARGLRNSHTGRVLLGVRENERAVQAYGENVTVAKLTAFAFSGFLAAFAGSLFVHHQQVLGSDAYSVGRSLHVFIMTIIGGLGSIPGAILGVVVIEGIGYFKNLFPSALRNLLDFLTGPVGLIFVLLMIPGGLSQPLFAVRDQILRRIAERRGIIVPSLVADMRTDLETAPALEGEAA